MVFHNMYNESVTWDQSYTNESCIKRTGNRYIIGSSDYGAAVAEDRQFIFARREPYKIFILFNVRYIP